MEFSTSFILNRHFIYGIIDASLILMMYLLPHLIMLWCLTLHLLLRNWLVLDSHMLCSTFMHLW